MQCLFCKIGKGELPCNKIFEDPDLMAFKDISPQAPTHLLVIPKRHISSLNDLTPEDAQLMGHIMTTIPQIVSQAGIDGSGYRVVFNTGKDGAQTVLHIHAHILGGRSLEWPPG